MSCIDLRPNTADLGPVTGQIRNHFINVTFINCFKIVHHFNREIYQLNADVLRLILLTSRQYWSTFDQYRNWYCLFQDPRFNEDIDIQTGYKTHSILSMPIKDNDGEVIGVAQAVNKLSIRDMPFNEHDEKVSIISTALHQPFGKVRHNSRIESCLRSITRITMYKKASFC